MDVTQLGISTAWNARGVADGRRIVDQVTGLGFGRLEVDYRVREEAVAGIAEAVEAGRIEVTSVHNFAPLFPHDKPSFCDGDKLPLSSLDEAGRAEAVRLTGVSIDLARSLGARALVLHTGEVDGIGRAWFKELCEVVRRDGVNSPNAIKLRDSLRAKREAGRQAHVDAVVRSLVDLIPRAEAAGVTLCIENRYFYHQIAITEDVLRIKEEIPSPWVRYWHDLGHAHVMEVLGFEPHLEALDRLKDHLFGMHVHDSNFVSDHVAPGTGEIDFASVLGRAPAGVLKILEISASVTAQEIRGGVEYLKGLTPAP
jgi:sugar phosphate isomerase/epimerase